MTNWLKNIFSDNNSDDLQALRRENERLKNEIEQLKESKLTSELDARTEAISRTTYNIIRDLLNNMSDASLLLAGDGEVLYANDGFLRQYGLTREHLHGKVYAPELNIITSQRFNEKIENARKHGGKATYERVFRNEDGSEVTVQVAVFIYELLGKETIWYFFKDTTELTKSRTNVRELNNLLDSILDNLPVYLFVKEVDNDLRYLYWNKAFAEYSKIPASRVIGHTDFEVFPDYNDAQKFRNDDLEVISSGESITRHETYEAADGSTRIVHTLKNIIHREGRGPLLVGTSIDITSLSNIEQEMVQERIKAEEADRLKTRFLANMSHEIRTPLNAIVGFSALLAETDDKETREQYANIIEQNNGVLLQLINDILDISKIEAGELEFSRAPMDLVDICYYIYEAQKRKMPKGVELKVEVPVDNLTINEDCNRIAQVINNLINNAAKFTRRGEIRFGFNILGESIEVFVSDTGIGIPADKLDKIFERFVQLDKFAQGTGLGLSICKIIVETMGGKMNVESEQGKGSTFKFTIPFNLCREIKSQKDEPKQEEPQLRKPKSDKPTILVAEDETSNYLYVKALVKDRYNLLWARDGSEAVQLYTENKPDLILMDIKMPLVDGLAATKLIRAHSHRVPIVALTANAYDSDRYKALDAGMNDFMSKPVDRELFYEMLNKYLAN